MAQSSRQEILTSADRSRWQEALDRIGQCDFCHLPSYNELAELSGQGRARLLVFEKADCLIVFPILLREIEGPAAASVGEGWRDVTSVYGYAGPVASCAPIPDHVRRDFVGFVGEFFRDQRVVAAFSRLHPLLEQISILGGYGERVSVGPTLSIDLTLPVEQQWRAYRRNHRQDIRRLQSMGVTCKDAGAGDLDDFVAMYYDTMDRVGAAPDYYFSRSYFEHLLTDMPEVARLFMCRHDGLPIAGGIFTICRGIVQWYLSGSRTGFPGPPPTKLVLDFARRWASGLGAHTLHLGGGVGGTRDSLFHFKRGFAQREHEYALWRLVVNQEVYAELSRTMLARYGRVPDDGFFPRYRHPAFSSRAPREVALPGRQPRAASDRTGTPPRGHSPTPEEHEPPAG